MWCVGAWVTYFQAAVPQYPHIEDLEHIPKHAKGDLPLPGGAVEEGDGLGVLLHKEKERERERRK